MPHDPNANGHVDPRTGKSGGVYAIMAVVVMLGQD